MSSDAILEITCREEDEHPIYVSYDPSPYAPDRHVFLAINGPKGQEADTHMSLARARMLVKALETVLAIAEGES